jgi:hypothetical protein
MVDQNAKQFATYVLSQLIPMITAGSSAQDFIGRISTVVPGINAAEFKNTDQWQTLLLPRVVDYFSQSYKPGAAGLKATA